MVTVSCYIPCRAVSCAGLCVHEDIPNALPFPWKQWYHDKHSLHFCFYIPEQGGNGVEVSRGVWKGRGGGWGVMFKTMAGFVCAVNWKVV